MSLASAFSRAADSEFSAVSAAVEAHMAALEIPGGQVAVGRGGAILFSRGFGLTDREKSIAVQPRTLFRIASISKPLTAVAVLTLVEDGALSLDGKMLDVLKPDIFLPAGREVDGRLKDITIRHLLQHTGGWDRDKSGDPMFQSGQIAKTLGIAAPPATRDVIREVLGRPLDSAPGERYAYSNFGFCVLGRIIEKLTGKPYEQFVRERVLLGIAGPRLGATLTQAEGEARYYINGDGQTGRPVFPNLPDRVPWPYGGFCLEMMDSHGGWISSAEDIVRFAMSLDDIGGRSPFKKRETWDALIAPPPSAKGQRYYGCGFSVRRADDGASISHDGSLPGTATYLWRRADGLTWAAFFNQRSEGKRDSAIVDAMLKAL